MNTRGVTLIELMVGLALSALIGSALFTTFFQSTRTLRVVEEYAELDVGLSVALHQLEKDCAGACVLMYEKTLEEPEPQAEAGQEKKQEKKSFFAKSKNKQLEYVTFITTNPRSRYGAPLPTAVPKPSLVRVAYKLIEHKDRKNAFMLVRQESTNLDPALFLKKDEKSPRALTLIDTVKECMLEFMYRDETKDNELQTVNQWGIEQQEEKVPPLPFMVKLRLTLWDARFAVTRSIEYLMPIYSTYIQEQQLQQEQASSPQPPSPQQPYSARPLFMRPQRKSLATLMGRRP